MNFLKHIAVFVLTIACVGEVFAQPYAPYPDRMVVAQRRVLVRQAHPVGVPVQQRRFVMPPGGVVYQRGPGPQVRQYPLPSRRATRMSIEERRALRQQINEANRGIYRNDRNNRGRGTYPRR